MMMMNFHACNIVDFVHGPGALTAHQVALAFMHAASSHTGNPGPRGPVHALTAHLVALAFPHAACTDTGNPGP